LRHAVGGTAYGGSADVIDTRAICLARETLARHSGLADFAFAMPSFAEQCRIVGRLEELHKETHCLESIHQQKVAALEALKKSLLHQAFTGRL
jgi:hypothetical protein